MFSVIHSRSFILVQCLLIIGHLNAASIPTTNPITEETTPDPPNQLPWKQALTVAIQNLTRLLGKIDLQVKTPPPSASVLSYYKDCNDAYSNGHRKSAIYLIKPDQQPPFQVYCNMDTLGKRGWTVIQRRRNGNKDFDLPWKNYTEGFGNLEGDFWLGLEKIYRLTSSAKETQLEIVMTNFEGRETHATYSHFALGPHATRYKLIISGYNGTAGDGLSVDVGGAPFSTRDNDNDDSTILNINCAAQLKGGWWYRGNQCGTSNLNGEYLAGNHPQSEKEGVYWHFFGGAKYSLKTSEMKIIGEYE